ncbi:SsgA family sporulation/cell division regulator [Saccharothrix sp. ST-888]|uniref:SsgA family sporulation/cell division regulator n=1 Tax=Saccharothrix sp. ST-888 TaxID=1427391 RepID=UPI000B027813|nr:SsgA family sporulation/cell division regulator [Saccharothrix sp. ST-888]
MRFREQPEDLGPLEPATRRRLHTRLAMDLESPLGPRFPLQVEFDYREDDPLVVRLTFPVPGDHPVTWAVSRELLLAGLSAPSGTGDVQVRPAPGGLVELHLHSTVGSALLLATAEALHAVLLRTGQLVPFGTEVSEERLHRGLERLLRSPAGEG